MSKPWITVELGRAAKYRKEFIQIDDLETYKRCRVQLHAQGIVRRDIVSGSEIKTKKQQVCRAGEFLVAEIDAKVGGFGIVPDELDGAIVSSHYFIFQLDDAILDRGFLNYFIRTRAFRDQVVAQGSTNYAAIRPTDVLSYKIPLLPLSEQKKLVARIDELANKIKEVHWLRQQAIDGVVTIFPSVFTEVFDGLLGNRKTERLASDELAHVVAGQHIMAGDYNDEGSGFPYITGPADFGQKVPKIKRWTHKPKTTALPGDVLLTVKGAGVGKLNLAPSQEVAIGRQLMAIRPNPRRLNNEFLAFLLKHRLKHFQSIATSTTVPGFKKTHVEDIAIPSISVEEQRHIVDYLDNLQAKVDVLKRLQAETAAEIESMLPSVLYRAFKY